jgi:hypothetical protein
MGGLGEVRQRLSPLGSGAKQATSQAWVLRGPDIDMDRPATTRSVLAVDRIVRDEQNRRMVMTAAMNEIDPDRRIVSQE